MMKTDLIKQIAKQTVNNIIFTAVFLLLAVACRNDELVTSPAPNPPAGKDKAQVTIAIHIPGMRTPGTRAVNDETLGFPISVLAFKMEGGQEKLKFMKVFQTQSDPGAPDVNTGSNPFAMHLRGIDEGDYNRLCILTSTDVTGKLTAGTSTLDNLKQLDITGGMDPATGQYVKNEIPMYGELKLATQNGISIKAGVSKVFTEEVKFLRAMARIEVKKQHGPGTVDAVLEKVYFCRSVKNGRIYGDKDNYTTTLNLPGSLEANITPVDCGSISPANMTVEQNLSTPIYAYEQPASGTIGTDGARIIVKIAGFHSGFYPIDFIDDGTHGKPKGTPIPIRRNHKYLFNITAVNAPGYATLQEALQSKEIFTNENGITATLLTVDESMKNIIFNSGYYLTISEDKITEWTDSPLTRQITVQTDVPGGFSIACYNQDGSPITDSWLTSSSAGGGANAPQQFTISLNGNYRGRTGYLEISAGRLEARVKVILNPIPLMYVAEHGLVGGYTGAGGYAVISTNDAENSPAQKEPEVRWATSHNNDQNGCYPCYLTNGSYHSIVNPNRKNLFADHPFLAGYHMPAAEEINGIFSNLNFQLSSGLNSVDGVMPVRYGNISKTYYCEIKSDGGPIAYGLHLQSAAGGLGTDYPGAPDDSERCAYRYEAVGTPGNNNNYFHLKVSSVWVGDDYSVDIDAVANESFWNARRTHTVTRIFPNPGQIANYNDPVYHQGGLLHRGSLRFYYWIATPPLADTNYESGNLSHLPGNSNRNAMQGMAVRPFLNP